MILKDGLINFIASNIKESFAGSNISILTLPILDSCNDFIEVYIKEKVSNDVQNTTYVLSDDGWYTGDANLEDKKIFSEIEKICKRYNAKLNADGGIVKRCKKEKLYGEIILFAQCLSEVSNFVEKSNLQKETSTTFEVKDLMTGEYPDLEKIAKTEDWASGLVYCDMQGFQIDEDGSLYLADECGNSCPCPRDRFYITVFLNGKSIHSFKY